MWRWLVLVALVLLGACGGTTGGAGSTGRAQIDGVDVRIAESFPPQVFVHVTGVLGDGCTSLGAISQQRAGGTIDVTVATNHRGAQVCTMVAQLVDQTIKLDGDFPAGEYIVRVNGVEQKFRV